MSANLSPHCPHFPYQPIFFNQPQFRVDLKQKPPLEVFRSAIQGVKTHLNHQFQEGEDIRYLINEYSVFIDLILHYAWHQYSWQDDITLVAVGGYGRRELHPHSDIDILILLERAENPAYEKNLQTFITFLWDIGLEIGHSVRTLEQCIEIARQDLTVVTNLMEARRITGNDLLRDQLQILTGPEYMWSMPAFFSAKMEEQEERHKKHNDTEYNLEPNIKNAPGGLRDIQNLNWIAKRYFNVQTLRELEGKDFFTEYEFGILRSREAFLWRVRHGVHVLAKRAEERLLFEYQRELAQQFGYQDSDKGLAVEQFMHEYYLSVSALRELNEVLLQYLKEIIFAPAAAATVMPINQRFQLRDNAIEVVHDKVFEQCPSALLEIFVLMGQDRNIDGVRASSIRLIRESRWLVNEKFRRDPTNNQLFMQLFSLDFGLVSQLTRMKRFGILGRYLPEFGRVIGQMQHDLFHRYTVDAHTLLVIRNMRLFHYPDSEEKFPVAAHIMKRLPKPELLYIAGLYHDIGKGRGGDHSILGAEDARLFCQRHNISPRETRLVTWLVEKHLLMSYVSQKRDTTDPEVIRDFALTVGDQLHLDYLYTLTVADMCGTNPDIWNAWRANLLRQLYLNTKRVLRRGLEKTIDKQELIEETQQLARLKLADKNLSETTIRKIWSEMGDDYFVRENHLDIAWQTEAIASHQEDKPLILIRKAAHDIHQGATQIFVRVKDQPRVFATVAGTLAQMHLNIQDARVYSSNSGYTIDTFYVLDENDQPIGCDKRITAIHDALLAELALVSDRTGIVHRRTPRVLKQFAIPTQTNISNDLNKGYTVLEVISPDRPGFLATIGHIFVELGIKLINAKISTLGERVEDVFFISDQDGHALSDDKLCEQLQKTIRQRLDLQVEQEKL